MKQQPVNLIYVHDPMCSWCWGFSAVYDAMVSVLPENINLVRVLGGLAPDSDLPMPEDMKQYLSQTWSTIQTQIPGTEFNFDFWTKCQPRRSTYPACRAVVAAGLQGDQWDTLMTRGIQEAYYLNARNPSDNSTLIQVAEEMGLDKSQFETDLVSESVQQILTDNLNFCRQLGVQGFPSLVLVKERQAYGIAVNYRSHETMLLSIKAHLSANPE